MKETCSLTISHEILSKRGFLINKEYITVLFMAERLNIRIDEVVISQVDTFNYLDVTIEEKGKHKNEIHGRTIKANN